jgi:hypothetical protein
VVSEQLVSRSIRCSGRILVSLLGQHRAVSFGSTSAQLCCIVQFHLGWFFLRLDLQIHRMVRRGLSSPGSTRFRPSDLQHGPSSATLPRPTEFLSWSDPPIHSFGCVQVWLRDSVSILKSAAYQAAVRVKQQTKLEAVRHDWSTNIDLSIQTIFYPSRPGDQFYSDAVCRVFYLALSTPGRLETCVYQSGSAYTGEATLDQINGSSSQAKYED